MHFSSVLLPLPLRPTMPKNSPCAIWTLMSLTACSSSYSVLRSGWSTRSLSVEYCWWGRRKVLLTVSIETAGSTAGVTASRGGGDRGIVVVKGPCTLATGARLNALQHVYVLVVLVTPGRVFNDTPIRAELRQHPLGRHEGRAPVGIDNAP